jgi:uncharacterized membrane protein (UPF0182 family)
VTVRPPRLPGQPKFLVPAIIGLFVVIIVFAIAVSIFTNYLWFSSVHFEGVYTTVLRTKIELFLFFGALMGVVVGLNIWLAHRFRPPFRPMSLEQQNLERYRVAVEPFQKLVVLGVGVLVGVFAGLTAAGRWQTWLLWRNRTDFGIEDPQFHKDVSFYAFTLPMERFALGFFLVAIALALVATAATHYLYGGLRLQTQGDKVSPAARVHLSVLLGLFVAGKALAYYLDRFKLLSSTRGQVQGGYTDINAVLPAKNILIWVAVICAVLFLANIRVRNVLLPSGALALLVLAAVLLGGILPAYTQQFRVKPNAIQRESDYIARNIKGTQAAYGLTADKVSTSPYGDAAESVEQAISTTSVPNARLLDPNRLTATFEQLQKNRNYFGVKSLDIDRYTVDGQLEDFVVAAREVDQTGLTANQKNWVNERLTYTHGNGLIMAQADQTSREGEPLFALPKGLTIDQPRIYFGEDSPTYSVVGTKQPEIDGPGAGDDSATFTYDGSGGVELSGVVRKLAYALKFRDKNLLLSSAITGDSRILYDRSPRDRVKAVAPFLEVDSNPYPAVVDGRIVWIVDGYTTSNGYPYAKSVPFGDVIQDAQNQNGGTQKQVNYIRNSVKATVDAYTGAVTLYQFGPTDPVLQTWDKAFGDIVKPQSEMSSDLLAHIRYPEDLFKVQRTLLAQFHVSDPRLFFSQEDQWQIPNDPAEALSTRVQQQAAAGATGTPVAGVADDGDAQPPYYSLMSFPGDPETAFRLSTSFTFSQRQNLAAFATVSSDPETYGQIRILQMPRTDNLLNGPIQIANNFLTNPTVSQALLSYQRNNNAQVTYGNMLTLPLSGGLLYIQPVYVQASGNGTNVGFPTLQLVLVGYGNQVAQGATLGAALTALTGASPTTPPVDGGTTPTPTATPTPTPTGTATPPADVAAAIKAASDAYAEQQAAFQRNDLTGYAAANAKLQAALQQLSALQSGSIPTPAATGSPTPTPTPS